MKQHGRKRPYTAVGIRRIPCTRFNTCGNMASDQWQICSDNRLYRPLCTQCDVELNKMVMRWAFGDTRETDLVAYEELKLERYR